MKVKLVLVILFFVLCVIGPAVSGQKSNLKSSSTSRSHQRQPAGVSHTHQLMSGSSLPIKTQSNFRIPVNAGRSTKWALKVFDLWREQRNERFPGDSVPDDYFTTINPNVLNIHLSHFIIETRKADGSKYPPATVHQLNERS